VRYLLSSERDDDDGFVVGGISMSGRARAEGRQTEAGHRLSSDQISNQDRQYLAGSNAINPRTGSGVLERSWQQRYLREWVPATKGI